ncbi:alpha-galactosidase 3, partial [Tanacetum coccineum]
GEDDHAFWAGDVDLNDKWPAYASLGGLNDLDMLAVGNRVMTYPEYTSHFSKWPLIKVV